MDRAQAVSLIRTQALVFAFLALSVALTSPVYAQATLVLQQGLNGYTGTSDSKIAAAKPTTNVGADSVNALIVDTSTALLVRFAIFQSEGGPLPNNASIVSATLSHYKTSGPDAVFKANRVLKNWTELGVTWTLTGTGASWSTAGVFSGDILSTADGQGSLVLLPNTACDVDTGWSDSCWLNIDVTAGVQAFQAGTPNFGWKLSFVSTTSDPSIPKDLYAKEITCCNREVRRPKLTISYRSPPIASFTASPASGPAALAVSFNASATTDGGSPITNLRLQFGDGTPDVNWTNKSQVQTHTYSAAGNYTATLTATNAIGTSSPATQAIGVTAGATVPTASFTATPSSGAAPLPVTFNASSSVDGSSAITSLTLQFGDGQQVIWSSKTATQSHTYTTAGNYTATLTAANSAGTSAPASRAVTVTSTTTSCTPSTRPAASGVAVPTFHSTSLYYNPPSAPGGDTIFLRYRKGSDPDVASSWKQGHPLWYDSGTQHAFHGRGSVVHLNSGTPYVFEVSTDNVSWQYVPGMQGEACPATWSESFPTGTVVPVWSGPNQPPITSSSYLGSRAGSSRNHVLLANQSGTANGYTLYDFTGMNAVAQTSNSSNFFPVVISGSYIILKGLKVIGGESGILIDPGSHDIVIDSVEVTRYGRDTGTALPAPLTGNQGGDEDAGIKFPDSTYGPILDTKRIVIQRSRIHNPAFGSSSWRNGGIHPAGPTAIMMYPTGGQIVIRYNETYATTDDTFGGPPDLNHYNQDGLVMGGCNGTGSLCAGVMGIGPDVDIYKNRVMNYMDDGLEVDGNATNDRVWKNYFDYGGASAVSTAPVSVGPAYVWRNVYNRQRQCISDDWGNSSCNDGGRDPMHKNSGNGPITGKTYIYHNTSLQPPASSEGLTGNPLGAGGGSDGGSLVVTRNNVFEIWKQNWNGFGGASGDADANYDLTNANCWTGSLPTCTTTEANGYTGTTPQYQNQNATDGTANGWRSYWNGKYRLVPGTPGYDDGTVIPNFNDGYVGAKPDRGAHEDGTPDMDFGPAASGS
jgi:PKD repeat protein